MNDTDVKTDSKSVVSAKGKLLSACILNTNYFTVLGTSNIILHQFQFE